MRTLFQRKNAVQIIFTCGREKFKETMTFEKQFMRTHGSCHLQTTIQPQPERSKIDFRLLYLRKL